MTLEQLAKFIDSATTCLVGSVDENGFPQTRAMLAVRHRNGIKEFFLTTNTSSQKVQQFKANEKASIYFYDPMNFIWMLFIWTMEVSPEKADKDVVWRKGDELYYPKGFDDPDFSVLKFTAIKVKQYSNFSVKEMKIV